MIGGHIPTNVLLTAHCSLHSSLLSLPPPLYHSYSLPSSLCLSLLPTMSVDVSPLVLHLLLPMLSKVLPLPMVLPSTLPLSLARMRRLLFFNLLSAEIITYAGLVSFQSLPLTKFFTHSLLPPQKNKNKTKQKNIWIRFTLLGSKFNVSSQKVSLMIWGCQHSHYQHDNAIDY